MSLLCVNFSLDSSVNDRIELSREVSYHDELLPLQGQVERPQTHHEPWAGVKLTTLGKLGRADLNPGSLGNVGAREGF